MMSVLKKKGIRVLRSSIEIKGVHVISRMEMGQDLELELTVIIGQAGVAI
jgi:hypothetical protein